MNEPKRPLAIVTGASSGIGQAYARKLAARGFDLLLVARREERLAVLAHELSAQHAVHAEALVADLTNPAQLGRVEERTRTAERLELLVNNAGFGYHRGPFFSADVERQVEMQQLHVVAVVRLCHAALAAMMAHGSGNIVNVSSVAAFGVAENSASYCASKAWINRFSEGLYLDLAKAKSPVGIQILAAGYTLTEFHEVAGVREERIPGFMWMSADSVVETSLRALRKQRLFVQPSLLYTLAALFLRILPRCLLYRVAGGLARRLGLRA